MTEQATVKDGETDIFREDFAVSARSTELVFWAVLVIAVLCILTGVTNQGINYFLGGLLAFFGFAAELLRKRALRNAPIITIGSEGVSFPQKDIAAIPWDRVTQVRVKKHFVRGTTIMGLQFRLQKGTLSKWQFGALGVDRWEIITNISTIFGNSLQIDGGTEALIASVERFHPVQR